MACDNLSYVGGAACGSVVRGVAERSLGDEYAQCTRGKTAGAAQNRFCVLIVVGCRVSRGFQGGRR